MKIYQMKNQFSKVNFENNYFPGSQKFAVEMGDSIKYLDIAHIILLNI